MRTAARLTLAFLLVLGAAVALPLPASKVLSPNAHAQVPLPTPTLPDILPSTDPLPGTGDDDDDDDDGGKKGGGGSGGTGGTGSGSDTTGGDQTGKGAGDALKKKNKKGKDLPLFDGTYVPGGSLTTNRLVTASSILRSLGLPQEQVETMVYPPFIIAGRAAWQNTWGAPRFGPGPIVRQHEGQDVFCRYGDPVLAPQAGVVSYSDGGLGGVTARVHISEDEYWYLTHLSETNELVYPMGSSVETGDVVGFCGNSGNALTTPPHVHFGWYVEGEAQNPHRALRQWLRVAEEQAAQTVADYQSERLARMDRLTFARRFGDDFVPGAGDLQVVGGSLWASGSSPTGGALSLAEAALQAALSRGSSDDFVLSSSGDTPQAPRPGTTRPTASELAGYIRTNSFVGEEHNHD